MAKKPDDRYQTPAEVDDALAVFAGQTVVINPEGRRTKDKGQRTRTRRPVRALVLCTLAFVLLAAGAVVYRIQTDNGELVITTDDPDVEVIIKQNGKLVRIIDTKTNKEVRLRVGLLRAGAGRQGGGADADAGQGDDQPEWAGDCDGGTAAERGGREGRRGAPLHRFCSRSMGHQRPVPPRWSSHHRRGGRDAGLGRCEL